MRPLVMCVVLCALVLTGAVQAEVPSVMSYQGVLKDSTGARVPDGLYDLTFRLYTAPMGGSAVWTEMQAVYSTDGVVDALLGDVTPLGKSLFGQELWLGISVDYEPELYPRTQLTTAPYAFRAAVAESLIGGGGSGGDSDWLFNGTGDIYRLSGDVGIGETQPNARLDVVAPSGGYAIHATATDSLNTAGRFVAEGNGVGLVASSQGWGSALYSWAQGSGYAGHFVGGNGVRIDGMCDVDAFQMYPNSTAGHVLTSDASGVGTWQAPTGGGGEADSDWMVVGDDMYSQVAGNVGIGTTTPQSALDVRSGDLAATIVHGTYVADGSSYERAMHVTSDGFGHAGWFTTSGTGGAVLARALGDGHGVSATAEGSGNALWATSNGTGYSGRFSGGTGVLVDDGLEVSGDATVDGLTTLNDILLVGDAVFVGPTPPAGRRLNVDGDGGGAAAFATGSDWASAIFVDNYNGTAGRFVADGAGHGVSAMAEGSGYSGYFEGGSGVQVDGVLRVDAPAHDWGVVRIFSGAQLHDAGGNRALYVSADDVAAAGWFNTWGSGTAVQAWAFGDGKAVSASADNAEETIYAKNYGTGYSARLEGGSGLLVETEDIRVAEFRSDNVSNSTHVVHAEVTGTTAGHAVAVYGESNPAGGYGYGGEFVGGKRGVTGWGESAGTGETVGVLGSVGGPGGSHYGVWGDCLAGDENYCVYGYTTYGATDFAGYFRGNVHVTGTLTEGAAAMRIDHPLDPEGKYLSHANVVSPDMMSVYNGNAVLDGSGSSWVELPEWFETLNGDFRYQLTCIGGFAPVYVAQKIAGNRFQIGGGEPGMEISWQVTGIRHDRHAEEHPVVVEEQKPAAYQGKYLNPELFGAPREKTIGRPDEAEMVEGR